MKLILAAALTALTVSACGSGRRYPAAGAADLGVTVPSFSISATGPSQPASRPAAEAPLATHTPSQQAVVAVTRYLHAAALAFRTDNPAILITHGHAICATLHKDPSVHDAVGDLAGQTGGQMSAQQTVQAAIAAFCPDTPAS